MNLLFFLTVFLFSFGQLGRISFLNQKIKFYLYEVFIIISTFYLLYRYRLKPIIENYQKLRFFYFFIAFLCLGYLVDIFKFKIIENLIAFLYLSRLIMYFLYGNLLNYWAKKNKFNRKLPFIILSLSLVMIFFSFIQYILYPDLRNLSYLGWDEHLYRMFGLFFDTSIAAAIYGLFFLYFLNQNNINKKIKVIFLFLFLTAIVLSFSRAAYLTIFLTLLVDLIFKKKAKLIFLFLTVFLLILLFSPKPFGEGVNLRRQFSIISRVNDYRLALNIWRKHPFFGIGYNRIGFYKEKGQMIFPSHSSFSFSSSYLIILVTGGIIGFLLFLLALFKLFLIKESGRIYLFFVYTFSLFDNIILHPFIMFLLILFLINDS